MGPLEGRRRGRPGARLRSLAALARQVVACRRCPRLVRHRELAAAEPPRRHRGQRYWARPLPGFGDPGARILLVGLAPAAHGGNRTGRLFTGDRSGDWLFRALWQAGLASQPVSAHRDDGLLLRDAYITATIRCAPPGNRPTPAEIERCRPYLLAELSILSRIRVVVALGRIGWNAYLQARRAMGLAVPRPQPRFGHGVRAALPGGVTLLGSFHPSQQNTFTGRLTRPMMRAVLVEARRLAAGPTTRARSPRTPRRTGTGVCAPTAMGSGRPASA